MCSQCTDDAGAEGGLHSPEERGTEEGPEEEESCSEQGGWVKYKCYKPCQSLSNETVLNKCKTVKMVVNSKILYRTKQKIIDFAGVLGILVIIIVTMTIIYINKISWI